MAEAARFSIPRFTAGGLAYDAVSRRFVLGNRHERKLAIVGEGSEHAVTLTGAAAQFLDVMAIEIDRRQGDLWVVSAGAPDDPGGRGSALHKLQLISGRTLAVLRAEDAERARFVDVAVSRTLGVLVLDAAGPRLLRATADGKSLARVIELPAGVPAALAPADGGEVVYVAYADGLVRVDLTTRMATPVAAGHGLELGGFQRIRWHRGALVGIQARSGDDAAESSYRLVRLRLARDGRRVVKLETLDGAVPAGAGSAAALLDDDFFYLSSQSQDGEAPNRLMDVVIRRVRLR
jgi:hypothetical protein